MIVGKKSMAYSVYAKRSKVSIEYALDKIRKSRIAPYVQDLYLYGSCARKEQDYDSDVDLFLVLSSDIDEAIYHEDLLLLKSNVSPTDSSLPEVDLHIEIGDNWQSSKLMYYENIKKEGIRIWKME